MNIEMLVGIGHLHASVALTYAHIVDLMRQAEQQEEEELAAALLEALGCLHGVLLVPSP